MPTITTNDGTEIYYKDWGSGQPIVFSHGWPLSADDWDAQMLFFLNHGYRVIAHDRRGHGRSSQTSDGHDMDHYADDLAGVTAHLDLKNAIHVGHSTGGGEVVHYLARHGESSVEHLLGQSLWIGRRLHHQGRYRADDGRLTSIMLVEGSKWRSHTFSKSIVRGTTLPSLRTKYSST